MGLLALLGRGPLTEKKISKISKLACNPFAQPDVRMREMQRLLEDGSPESLRGVLKRFGANANGHIADEEEKQYLEDAIVEQGSAAQVPLEAYIKSETQLTYALRAYQRLMGDEAAVEFFIACLERLGPDDHRSLEAKLQLTWSLADHLDHPRIIERLLPFLNDHSDDVQWAVMDLLDKALADGRLSAELMVSAGEYLGEAVSATSASPRIVKRAASFLAEHEWKVPAGLELSSDLDETYFVDKKGFLRLRVKSKK